MARVTYLLGAGASADTIPVVENFNKDLERISRLLGTYLEKNLNDEAFKLLPTILQEKNAILENIVKEIEWLLLEAANHQTIDTLAKKFYLTNSDDLNKLKRILIVYFQIRQALIQPDKRYDSFLAAISKKKERKLSFSEHVRVITWNYDLQLELSIKRYVNENISALKELFQIFPNNVSLEQDANELYDKNNFAAVKMNGNAFWSIQPNAKEIQPTVLDNFFGKYESAGSIIAQAINEYDHIFNNSSEGNKFLEMFNFAWERNSDFTDKYSGYDGNLNLAQKFANETEVLVVIGYSFPVFNRETDSTIIESMKTLRKVYIQDKNPERIKSTMINAFKIFQGPYHNQNLEKAFQLETNVNQFVIPYEL